MLELREYVDELRRSRYRQWLQLLDNVVRARITIALDRLSTGNVSNVKSVGLGVSELRINFGPGFRAYRQPAGKEFLRACCRIAKA